jgi:hypothetical protein
MIHFSDNWRAGDQQFCDSADLFKSIKAIFFTKDSNEQIYNKQVIIKLLVSAIWSI